MKNDTDSGVGAEDGCPQAHNGASDTTEILAWGSKALSGLEGADQYGDSRTILEWVMNVDSYWDAPKNMTAQQVHFYQDAITRRRNREPLQHIVGRMWFRSLTLKSRPGVFVVRPETEWVAQHAIDAALKIRGHRPLIADLCTGSGAIALAVATEVPGSRVLAVDQDPKAIALAEENSVFIQKNSDVSIDLSIIEDDATVALSQWEGRIDIVVSNPPYIPGSTIPTQPEALIDPATALYGGGEDGLVIPRGIVTRAARLLRPGGMLIVEHASIQSDRMRKFARESGFIHVSTAQDLTGRDRMLLGFLPEKGETLVQD